MNISKITSGELSELIRNESRSRDDAFVIAGTTLSIALGIFMGLAVIAVSVTVACKKWDAWSRAIPEQTFTNAWGNTFTRQAYVDRGIPIIFGILGSLLGAPIAGFTLGPAIGYTVALPLLAQSFRMHSLSREILNSQGEVDPKLFAQVVDTVGREILPLANKMSINQLAILEEKLGADLVFPSIAQSEPLLIALRATSTKEELEAFFAGYRLQLIDLFFTHPAGMQAAIQREIVAKRSLSPEAVERFIIDLEVVDSFDQEIHHNAPPPNGENPLKDQSWDQLYKMAMFYGDHCNLPQVGALLDSLLREKFPGYAADKYAEDVRKIHKAALRWHCPKLIEITTIYLSEPARSLYILQSREGVETFLKENRSRILTDFLEDPYGFGCAFRLALEIKKAQFLQEAAPLEQEAPKRLSEIEKFLEELSLKDEVISVVKSEPLLKELYLHDGEKENREFLSDNRQALLEGCAVLASEKAYRKALEGIVSIKQAIFPGVFKNFSDAITAIRAIQDEITTITLRSAYAWLGNANPPVTFQIGSKTLEKTSLQDLVALVRYAVNIKHVPLGPLLDPILAQRLLAVITERQLTDEERTDYLRLATHWKCPLFAALLGSPVPLNVGSQRASEVEAPKVVAPRDLLGGPEITLSIGVDGGNIWQELKLPLALLREHSNVFNDMCTDLEESFIELSLPQSSAEEVGYLMACLQRINGNEVEVAPFQLLPTIDKYDFHLLRAFVDEEISTAWRTEGAEPPTSEEIQLVVKYGLRQSISYLYEREVNVRHQGDFCKKIKDDYDKAVKNNQTIKADLFKRFWDFAATYDDWEMKVILKSFLVRTRNVQAYTQIKSAFGHKLPDELDRAWKQNPLSRPIR